MDRSHRQFGSVHGLDEVCAEEKIIANYPRLREQAILHSGDCHFLIASATPSHVVVGEDLLLSRLQPGQWCQL
jgi:hypothetical protein